MKPPILSVLSCLCLAFAVPVQGQVQQAWLVRHSLLSIGTNQPVAIALDSEENLILGGHGTSELGDFDYMVLKYSPAGDLLWQARVVGAASETMRGMAVVPSGRVVATGTGRTVKWGVDGLEMWSADYGGRALALDPSGDIYVTGYTETSFATVKLHRDTGTNLWVKTENVIPSRPDVSQVITVDGQSNVFIAGKVTCYWEPRSSYANRRTTSYDSDGNLRWATSVFPVNCEYRKVSLRGIRVDASGNVIVTGNVYGIGKTFSTIKYSKSGSPIWSYFLDAANFEGVQAMAMGTNDATFLTGSSGECITIKLSPDGVPEWTRAYGSTQPGYHFGNAIVLDTGGNVYVAGQSPGIDTGNDYATIKYSPSGQELWVQRYDGPAHGDDVATAIAVAPDGSVYVTGGSTTSSNLIEITTIKYTQSGPASLSVEPDRTVRLEFPGTPGATNRVQGTTDFLDWLELGFSITDTNGLIHFLDTNAPNYPLRFYRTVTP